MSNSATNDNSSAGTPEWDIFSFGVIMWELCTLNRPWEGIPSVQVTTIPLHSFYIFSFKHKGSPAFVESATQLRVLGHIELLTR
jgi:hypothetical protein